MRGPACVRARDVLRQVEHARARKKMAVQEVNTRGKRGKWAGEEIWEAHFIASIGRARTGYLRAARDRRMQAIGDCSLPALPLARLPSSTSGSHPPRGIIPASTPFLLHTTTTAHHGKQPAHLQRCAQRAR